MGMHIDNERDFGTWRYLKANSSRDESEQVHTLGNKLITGQR